MFGAIDRKLLVAINQKLSAPFLDRFFPWLTNFDNFLYILIIAAVGILLLGPNRWKWSLLLALLAFGLDDLIVNHVLKPLAGRSRPFVNLDDVRVLSEAARSSFSMPSAHAANSSAVVACIAWRHVKWIGPGIFIAFLVGYSRIYVGVHYPFDVLVGFLVGGAVGTITCHGAPRIVTKIVSRFGGKRDEQEISGDATFRKFLDEL